MQQYCSIDTWTVDRCYLSHCFQFCPQHAHFIDQRAGIIAEIIVCLLYSWLTLSNRDCRQNHDKQANTLFHFEELILNKNNNVYRLVSSTSTNCNNKLENVHYISVPVHIGDSIPWRHQASDV